MEEKIIDCIHKSKGSEICKAHSNNVFSWNCSEFNNCYYKQLKRLEQENEELKNTLKDIDKKLELALDVEQTDADESFDLLYEIQEIISEAIGE